MQFEPRQYGNPQGKPRGAKSEKAKQWEVLADAILNEHTERFNKALSALEDKEFIDSTSFSL